MKSYFALLAAGLMSISAIGCDVDVKEEGRAPDVDVAVDPGKVPDVDVRGPDVDVGTEKKEITVPDVDVDIPAEDEKEVDASAEPEV
jgi:hypothetical protein